MKRCPQCKEPNPMLFAGGNVGTYQCKKCGYLGPIILEDDD